MAVSARRVLLVPAQNMMRRDKAVLWQDQRNLICTERARETGMWLLSADVTGQREASRIGVGPTCVMDLSGRVVAEVPRGVTGVAVSAVGCS